jgi:dipeptidyl aminopeptidase/acylaminoacyl peptidase
MDQKSGAWTISGPRRNTIASGTNASGGAGLVSLGKDGSSLIYEDSDAADLNHWYEVPLDGSAARVELAKDEDLDRVYRSRADGRMIGYLRGGTQPKRIFFDPKVQALSDKIDRAFSHLDVDLEDWTPDFNRVLVRTSGSGDSGTWYLVDLTKMKADAIGMERPQVPRDEVGPVSSFHYKAADGLDMDGILTLPPGGKAQGLPVVLLPHGGPAAHDEVRFDWWAQAFASRGYAVFQPNFRGSDNDGQVFERAGDGQWGRKMQSDISDGLKALAAQGIVDSSRACIVGGSYGGYAALAGVTLQHGIYRCAVSIAGVSDVSLMYKRDYRESGDVGVVRQSLLQELGPRSGWDDISPIRFAKQADAPILLIHGRDDTVVSFDQSTKMADALKDAGKPYEFIELKGEDHWLSRSDTREQMLEATLAFVQKYNPAK